MSEQRSLRPVPLLTGMILLVVYIRIGAFLGFQASYGPPLHPGEPWTDNMAFVWISGAEHRFWLAHLLLALPAVMLIAWGLEPKLMPLLRRLVAAVDAATPRQWRLAAAAFGVLVFAYAVLANRFVLLGMPLTDDELTAAFGAKIIASGHLSVPVLQPDGAFNQIFTYQRDGMVSAMDFPGVLLFAALATVSRLGTMLYALAAAVSGVAVAYAAGRWFGARGRLVAAAVWIASPMVASLSMTGHAHVASRMFVALAIAAASRLDTESETARRDAVLFGLWFGLAFFVRPIEATAVLGPIAIYLVMRAVRGQGIARSAIGLAFAGMLPVLVLFAWWNAQITGVWYLQARFAPGTVGLTASAGFGPWDRVGFNLGFNALMLGVFFLGIPAIAAIMGAFSRAKPVVISLGAGVALHLLVGLAHDNTGIHSVGPIHVSESAVLLTLIVTAGILRGFEALAAWRLPRAPFALLVAAYLAGWCGLFQITNMTSMHSQAVTQQAPFDVLEAANVHNAIVFAPPYVNLLMLNPGFAPWGSWVLHYPLPDPEMHDDVLFVEGPVDPNVLHARYPDRALWQLGYTRGTPAIVAQPLGEKPLGPPKP